MIQEPRLFAKRQACLSPAAEQACSSRGVMVRTAHGPAVVLLRWHQEPEQLSQMPRSCNWLQPGTHHHQRWKFPCSRWLDSAAGGALVLSGRPPPPAGWPQSPPPTWSRTSFELSRCGDKTKAFESDPRIQVAMEPRCRQPAAEWTCAADDAADDAAPVPVGQQLLLVVKQLLHSVIEVVRCHCENLCGVLFTDGFIFCLFSVSLGTLRAAEQFV